MIYATTQPTLLAPRRIHKVDMKMFRISIYFAFTKKARKLGRSDGKASPYNAGDPGSIPGLVRFPGEGNGNPLKHLCLENPLDRGDW